MRRSPVARPAAERKPVVAVVIPAYRQPLLLVEAVQSVLRQKAPFEIAILIVDDGCPLAETALLGTSLALADPRITHLTGRNGGLSATRNRGIAHVLASMPSVQAIFFLDADNRIAPTAIASSLALLDPAAGIGWVYPNIDRFGTERSGNYSGPYSRLLHVTFDNVCEAGSLVAREVFEAGIRFDETMRDGCEDWEFWWQCLDKGFRGTANRFAGFDYRSRPESMVSGTKRRFAEIRERMIARHARLNAFTTLMGFEHEEAPRFLMVDPGTGEGHAFSDPAAIPRVLTRREIADALRAEAHEPDSFGLPGTLVCMRPETRRLLADFRIVWSLFNLIDRELANADLVEIVLAHRPRHLGLTLDAGADKGGSVHAVARRRGRAAEAGAGQGGERVRRITVHGPFGRAALDAGTFPAAQALTNFDLLAAEAVAPFGGAALRWSWRGAHFPPVAARADLIGRHLSMASPMPRIPADGGVHVGLAIGRAGFDDLSRRCFALARDLRRAGCHPHLFVFGEPDVRIPEAEGLHLASISFLADPDFPVSGGRHAHGGHGVYLERDAAVSADRVLGFLAGMDAVVNFEVAGVNAVAGRLRASGTRVLAYVQGEGRTMFGRPTGALHTTLAFEHALDAILTASRHLADELHAMGVPFEKLMPVVGGADVPFPPARLVASDARRPPPDSPLRVTVFLGQGVDEAFVGAVARRVQGAGASVAWRMIDERRRPDGHDELWRLLAETDVLFEPGMGSTLPLAVLDARQLGCVVLATNRGPLREIVTHGEDGLLAERCGGEDDAGAFAAHLVALAQDAPHLSGLGRAAMQRARESQGACSRADLVRLLRTWFPGKMKDEGGR